MIGAPQPLGVSVPESSRGSYGQVLKASSIIGGAQGINLLLGMVRVKFAAVLIGTVGVGLLGNYLAIQGLIATMAGLGIQSSAVREVAQAVGQRDGEAIGRTVLSLRRVCWLTGLLGAVAMAALSPLLSQWTFGSDAHALEIALLGLAILFGNLSGGQTALIQGAQRIGDLARLNIISAAAGTSIAIGCYAWLGLHGIVPALLLLSLVQLAASWAFARRVPVQAVRMSWLESIQLAGGMVRLGLVFMWNALIAGLVVYITRTLITQQVGLDAVGIFGAAFALSGMLINFIIGAMDADYYPRLTAVSSDHAAMDGLVNEQTEIALLLAVPGLLATLSLTPSIIQIFYTADFLPAAKLLHWFILGSLCQILSWPLRFVMLAQGKRTWFFLTETLINPFYLGLIWLGLLILGIEGAAIAFFLMHLGYLGAVYAAGRHLIAFRWSAATRQLLIMLLPLVGLTFFVTRLLPLWPGTLVGISLTLIAAVLCLRGLVWRMGIGHRMVRYASRIPAMRWVCGLSHA
jgi:antigen flippase